MYNLLASDFFKNATNRNWFIAFAVAVFVMIGVTVAYLILNKKLAQAKTKKPQFTIDDKDLNDADIETDEQTETPDDDDANKEQFKIDDTNEKTNGNTTDEK